MKLNLAMRIITCESIQVVMDEPAARSVVLMQVSAVITGRTKKIQEALLDGDDFQENRLQV